MIKTRITELLKIKHPIIQAGMAWVSLPPLVAAVSNAGGLGILGSAFMTPQQLRESIREIRSLTDKPFAVNFMPENPLLESLLDVVVEERVPAVSYGKGDPRRIIERTKPYGIINMPTVGALKQAIKAEEYGADAVIVQGTEGGGHTGFVATIVLVPLVVQKVKIPVVAAGGIGDARGLVAALALGAEGVSMGTRFIATKECPVPLSIKQRILAASEEDTVITNNLTGIRCRVIRNKLAETMLQMAEAKFPPEKMAEFAIGRFRKAFVEGDDEWGTLASGQVCGLINDIPSCQELIERIITEAEEILSRLKKLFGEK